jgi:hypothetical protein
MDGRRSHTAFPFSDSSPLSYEGEETSQYKLCFINNTRDEKANAGAVEHEELLYVSPPQAAYMLL